MNIDKIENGYVIDHIKAGYAMQIYNLLELSNLDCQVALITNAKSKKNGKKDIIKIAKLIDLNLDVLSAVDSNITVNVVKDNELIEKMRLTLPNKITNVYKCRNPRCITSVENGLDQVFDLVDKEKNIYRCHYCETKLEK